MPGRFPRIYDFLLVYLRSNLAWRDGSQKELSLFAQFAQCRVCNRLGGKPELLVEVLVRRAGPKRVQADEGAVRPDNRIPALPDSGFDRDPDRRRPDDRLAGGLRCGREQFKAWD